MQLHKHLLVSAPLLLLYPYLKNDIFLLMSANLFIDIDHIQLAIKEKAFTKEKILLLKKDLYNNYIRNPKSAYIDVLYLFHTIEFNIILLVASFFYAPLFYVFLGFMFHIMCDIIHHRKNGIPILRWLFIYKFIQVNTSKKNVKIK